MVVLLDNVRGISLVFGIATGWRRVTTVCPIPHPEIMRMDLPRRPERDRVNVPSCFRQDILLRCVIHRSRERGANPYQTDVTAIDFINYDHSAPDAHVKKRRARTTP